MNSLNNLKVAGKISVFIVLVAIALSVVGYFGFSQYMGASRDLNGMFLEHLVPIDALNKIVINSKANQADLLELMIVTAPQRNAALKKNIDDRIVDNNRLMGIFEKSGLDQIETDIVGKVKDAQSRYRISRKIAIDLGLANKNQEAYSAYIQSVRADADEYTKLLLQLAAHNEKLAQDTNAANQAKVNQIRMIILAMIATAILVVISFGWYLQRIITRPLSLAVARLGAMADGDFSGNIPAELLAMQDEFGQLANSFQTMNLKMQTVIRDIAGTSEQVAASSEELTASAEQSAHASQQVAVSISDVASGAGKQLRAIEETTAAIEQMSAGIQQAAASTAQVVSNSAKAASTAQTGGQSVDKAVLQMASIERTVATSSVVVNKLGERSKEIGQIVDTISGIAGQTNLLALNAAIEAARAGEQGRGFAVVADEVRKLAEQSQDAAKQIAELIREIQSDTDSAVESMTEGTREVKLGAQTVNAAGDSFRVIVNLVSQVSEQVREVSAVMQQMSSGSQQIVASVKQIDQLSKQAAEESETVSAATEEQSASMQEIASSSQGLARLAQNLQETVGKFRV